MREQQCVLGNLPDSGNVEATASEEGGLRHNTKIAHDVDIPPHHAFSVLRHCRPCCV